MVDLSGPTGNLYFDDVQDFESIQNGVPVLHSYKITEVMQGGRYTVVVEFSNSVKGPSAPYAKVCFHTMSLLLLMTECTISLKELTSYVLFRIDVFSLLIIVLQARIIIQNGLNGYQYYGKWATFGLVGINATVSKRPGENTVLTFASTRVTLTNNRNSVVGGPFGVYPPAFYAYFPHICNTAEISGEFFFRDQITLQGSPRVFYTNGAIIFYRPRGVNPDNTAYVRLCTESWQVSYLHTPI